MACQFHLPQILDALAGGVPPVQSSSGAGGVLIDLPRVTALNIAVIL
jgi:hypothetical protein